MPLLNDATAVYLGGTPAQAVYAGSVKVWPGSFVDRGPFVTRPVLELTSGSVAFDQFVLFPSFDPEDQDGRRWLGSVISVDRWFRFIRASDSQSTSHQITRIEDFFGGWMRVIVTPAAPAWADSTELIIEVWEDQP